MTESCLYEPFLSIFGCNVSKKTMPTEVAPEGSKVVADSLPVCVKVMIGWKTKGTQLYQQLPANLYQSLKECQPLTEIPEDRKTQQPVFKTWNETQQ